MVFNSSCAEFFQVVYVRFTISHVQIRIKKTGAWSLRYIYFHRFVDTILENRANFGAANERDKQNNTLLICSWLFD